MLMVFTLGFHADHVIRRLFKVREQSIDAIHIVTARPVVRAVKQAYSEIVSIVDRMRLPPPKLFDIAIESPAASTYILWREWREHPHIVADLSGGMRPVVAITMTALALTTQRSYVELYIAGEREDAAEARIPLNIITYALTKTLSQEKKEILQNLLKTPGLTQHHLAQLLGKSDRTIRAHLSELKKYELVQEKEKKLYPTDWAKILIELNQP
ncbi:MAG: CRISPR locus-related DNA-binding protein, partial [Crenarchaeota archaeon]|nr:CRISPR locus-related DNA-binding protein [Thermoproteota archaeon]